MGSSKNLITDVFLDKDVPIHFRTPDPNSRVQIWTQDVEHICTSLNCPTSVVF